MSSSLTMGRITSSSSSLKTKTKNSFVVKKKTTTTTMNFINNNINTVRLRKKRYNFSTSFNPATAALHTTNNNNNNNNKIHTINTTTHSTSFFDVSTSSMQQQNRRRGRMSSKTNAAASSDTEPQKKVTESKPRLPAMDSMRFFLIGYIAIGHFIACATRDPLLLKMLSQVNVVVGAFFVLSGYVAAYTASELNKYEHTEKRFLPTKVAYTIQRVMGYYPLYFATQILFMPVFLIADVTYNGWAKSALHAGLTFSLSQAWFPSHAELWNAPTWFLSALTFAFVVLPYALPSIAKLKREGLQRLFVKLILLTCLVKFAYCYDVSGFAFFEGTMPPKTHPSWMFWNSVRFSPLFSTIDVLIGAVSARLVMIDGVEKVNFDSVLQKPVIPLLLMIGLIVGRGYSIVSMSDAIARSIFVPLFAWFTMNIHRETVSSSPRASQFSISSVLSWKPLTYLGAISFPIYILHGPIGQIFYKRVVANKIFGFVFTSKPEFFPVWIGIVLVSAAIVNEVFLKNKKVQELSKNVSNSLVSLSISE